MDEVKKKRVPALSWMRNPIDISQIHPCSLPLLPSLDSRLEEALRNMGVNSLFPVQVAVWQETFGAALFDRDLCVNSPTGTGKTLAYALPIVQALSPCQIRLLRALVVLPTRDLALQVKEVFAAIAPSVGLRVGLAAGQSSIEDERSELVKKPKIGFSIYDSLGPPLYLESSVDILVATPGRLMDHINTTKGFTLEHLRFLVVDETDRLLQEAYQSWLPTVLQMVVPTQRLMKVILSATLTQDPSKLSQLDLHRPLFLSTGNRRYQLPEKLEAYKLICESKLKPLYLAALLQDIGHEQCIIFTSSVESTHRLFTLLNSFEGLAFKISEFSGLQRQSIRRKTLKAFRAGEIQVLVASDAMTRGMDVEGVNSVINYDMPTYIKTYIHRVGRTARAGRTGRCFTLLRKHEVKRFKELLQKAGNNACTDYSLPGGSIELLRPIYYSALEKLKESIESKSAVRGTSSKLVKLGRQRNAYW